ncbi:MAG TPA: SgcJ/EcaC family oxidoreductase, partial [Pirellulales bacterium]
RPPVVRPGAPGRPAAPARPAPAAPSEAPSVPAAPASREERETPERQADREAIESAAQAFVSAFEKGDAKAIAAQWTESGEFHSDSGESLVGRAAIEKSYADYFAKHPKSTLQIEIAGVRFPSQDIAIEDGVLWATADGPTLPTSTRYSVLHVREGGVWKMAFGREWGGAAEKLTDLAWLVGDWKSAAKDHEVEMSYEWNADKTVLLNHFTRKEGGKTVAHGTQWIGVNPANGRLRSWSADDEGGRGESVWFRDGESWVAAATGQTPSGEVTASMNLISRVGSDEIVWKSVRRTVNGVPTADTDPVKLERVKSEK